MRSRESAPTCPSRLTLARWLVVLALVAVGVMPGVAMAQKPVVTFPNAGTPVRKAVLDAVRRHLKVTSQFKVAHLAVSGTHAFVRAGEVVDDGENLQETDLFVEALLERVSNGRWRVVHLWNLSEEGEKNTHDAFLAKVRRVMTERALPRALLPDDLRPTPGA